MIRIKSQSKLSVNARGELCATNEQYHQRPVEALHGCPWYSADIWQYAIDNAHDLCVDFIIRETRKI